MTSFSGFAHVRLTVTDIERSREFYERVFGFDVALEVPTDADEQTREQLAFLYGGVIYQIAPGTMFGLRPAATAGDRFDADRVGLDHVSLMVESRSDLETIAGRLDELSVEHEDVKDIGMGFILQFRDPDNIALELTAPPE